MKIALIQLDIVADAKQANLAGIERLLRQAAEAACDVAVLPELCLTGFSEQTAALAEAAEGATTAALAALARTHQMHLIVGLAEKVPGQAKVQNLAVAYDRAGVVVAKYAKIHPFSFAQEDRCFLPGNRLVTFAVEGMSAGMFICYDLRFPEIFRSIAKDVAAFFVIANWPASRQVHWETLLRARAIENQCFVIGVNRTGADARGLRFPGASHIFDPLGQDLCADHADAAELLIVEIDPAETARVRATFPFLRDMRPFRLFL